MENIQLLAIDAGFNPDHYTHELEDEVIHLFTESAELAYSNGELHLRVEVQDVDELALIAEKLMAFSLAEFSEVLFVDDKGNELDRFALPAVAQFSRLRTLVG